MVDHEDVFEVGEERQQGAHDGAGRVELQVPAARTGAFGGLADVRDQLAHRLVPAGEQVQADRAHPELVVEVEVGLSGRIVDAHHGPGPRADLPQHVERQGVVVTVVRRLDQDHPLEAEFPVHPEDTEVEGGVAGTDTAGSATHWYPGSKTWKCVSQASSGIAKAGFVFASASRGTVTSAV